MNKQSICLFWAAMTLVWRVMDLSINSSLQPTFCSCSGQTMPNRRNLGYHLADIVRRIPAPLQKGIHFGRMLGSYRLVLSTPLKLPNLLLNVCHHMEWRIYIETDAKIAYPDWQKYCMLLSFIQAQIKENIKAPRYWPLCGEFTGDWWIPRTNGQ